LKATGRILCFAATRVPAETESLMGAEVLELLSQDERRRIERLRKPGDRNRAVVGRLLAKAILASVSRAPINTIHIERDGSGRPIVVAPIKDGWHLDLSLSHSGQWVVCTLAESALVGVDVEQMAEIDPGVMEYAFTNDEKRVVVSRGPEEQTAAFFDIWTCKEAYGKAIGKGITYDLLQLNINLLDNGAVQADFEGVPLTSHCFQRYEIDPQYRLSLCVNGADPPASVSVVDVLSWIASLKNNPVENC
jgi:4'-phosphopantetheinyl transferase